jgi:hypothetical protein
MSASTISASDEAAMRSALEQAERLTESDWARLEVKRESPLIEIAAQRRGSRAARR